MKAKSILILATSMLAALLLGGCQTERNAHWDAKIGKASFDDVVREMGPPERETKLSDGSRVGDWFQKRGGSWFTTTQTYPGGLTTYGQALEFPDRLIRLTFDGTGVLQGWKTVYR
jgi:hypothetical protein